MIADLLAPPRRPPTTRIDNVALLDPRDGSLLERQQLLTGAGRLLAVGAVGGELSRAPAERVIDGAGCVAAPGLIDCHLHTLGVYLEALPTLGDARWVPRQMLLNLRALARSGVTTARDMAAPTRLSFGARRLAAANVICSPRIIACGPILSVRGGYPYFIDALPPLAAALLGQVKVELDDAAAARREVERLARAGAELIKVGYSSARYDDARSALPLLAPELLRAIHAAARARRLPVAVHHTWSGDLDALLGLPFDCLEHLSIDAPISPANVERIRARGLSVTTTLMTYGIVDHIDELLRLLERDARLPASQARFCGEPRQTVERLARAVRDGGEIPHTGRRLIDTGKRHMLDNLRRLHAAGVLIGAGTDSGGAITPCGEMLWELRAMRQAGLSALEVLRAATSDAAKVVGRGDIGVLEPGRRADLILCRANPAEDLEALADLALVMRDGVVLAQASAA